MDNYKLYLTRQQLEKLEEGEDELGVMRIEASDGRIIESDDMDLVDILMGKDKAQS